MQSVNTGAPEKATDTVKEFCDFVGISTATFYREAAAGRIIARKIGHKTVIPRAERQRYIDSLPVAGIVGGQH